MGYQSVSDEQRKVDEIERWDQAVFRPNRIPTPSYLEHESYDQQRKRLINKVRPLVSEDLQKVRTDDVFGTALDHVAQQFLASATAEARRPTKIPEGTLKEVVSYDQAGRPSYTYFGSPSAWMNEFSGDKKYVAGIMDNRSFHKV
jgi:hypothetical protein